MDLPQRKVLLHEVPFWTKSGDVFFITICCQLRGENQLCRPEVGQALIESVRFRQERGDWYARLFLLMPRSLACLDFISARKLDESSGRQVEGVFKAAVGYCLATRFF
jgi:hypothetical protein